MADTNSTPPPLRAASTVILARENNAALEVYLIRRSTKSGFMGGLYVFPGGVVDPQDLGIDFWAPRIDMAPQQLGEHLGGGELSNEDALGFGIAAIRETLEEAGVLIASCKDKTLEDMDRIASCRLKAPLPKSWFRSRVASENWVVSLSSLGRWSNWITPELMKQRFDTRFFVASMPVNQTCVPDCLETDHGIWLSPGAALEQNLEAKIPLSPPTVVTLTQLSGFTGIDGIRHEIRTRPLSAPIMPRLVQCANGPVILEPWDPAFDSRKEIDTSDFSKKTLPPGAWFSRIWCDKGIWKPVQV